MKISTTIFKILLPFLITSCTTVNLAARRGKDIQLNTTDYTKLKGTFSNLSIDTNRFNFKRTLFENFTLDTLGRRQQQFYVDIIPVDDKTLTVNLYENGLLVKNLNIKGKFKDGYFKVKRQYTTKFIAGPLLWVLGEHRNYIGLTKDNNLVVLDSGGAGVLLLAVFPCFVAGGDKHDYEYIRSK